MVPGNMIAVYFKEREVMNRLPYVVSVLLAVVSNLHHTAPHLYTYAVKTLERTFSCVRACSY